MKSVFNNNEGIGGYEQLEYLVPVVQPTEYNWTRQLTQDVPLAPKMRKIASVKDRMIHEIDNFNTFIVLSSNEVLIVDSDSKLLNEHNSRLLSVKDDGTIKEVYRVEKAGKRALSPIFNVNGDLLLVTSSDSREQKYYLICLSGQYSLKWELEFSKPVSCNAVVDNSANIYIYLQSDGKYDGELLSISSDGHINWSVKLMGPINHQPPILLNNNNILVGIQSYYMYVINKKGTVERKFEEWSFGSEIWMPFIDRSGLAYLKDEVYNMNLDLVSDYSPKGIHFNLHPLVDNNGNKYVVLDDRRIACINNQNQIIWTVKHKGDMFRQPIIGRNGLCSFSLGGGGYIPASFIQIIDMNGNLKWESPPIKGAIQSILPSGDNRLYALVNVRYYNSKRDGNFKVSWELYEIS